MKKEKGFTLVELLIVVAIIGILAAIAIPQFNKYKVRGYVAALRSDLKNAHTAASAYLTDYPNGTISIITQLQRGGWKPSQNINFVSSSLTTSDGTIILNSTNLNTSNVDYPGTIPAPITSAPTASASMAQGKIAYEGTAMLPQVK